MLLEGKKPNRSPHSGFHLERRSSGNFFTIHYSLKSRADFLKVIVKSE